MTQTSLLMMGIR